MRKTVLKKFFRRLHLGTKIVVFVTFCIYLIILGVIEICNSDTENSELINFKLQLLEKNQEELEREESEKNARLGENLAEFHQNNFNFPDEENSEQVRDYVEIKKSQKKRDGIERSDEEKEKILEKLSILNENKVQLLRKPIKFVEKLKATLEIPGDLGAAVTLPSNISANIKSLVDEGWKLHEFNEYVSNMISYERNLPDGRDDYCKQPGLYLENLPKTSVIIIFHNEAWSTLLRSVYSVLNRSPEHLLEEIILVDDFSDMSHLKKPLDDFMSQFPKVKILRLEKREGLIKARLHGVKIAKAPTMTFLDSHIECSPGWLEPLLDRIARNASNVVSPVIDSIIDQNLQYIYTKTQNIPLGGFNWNLQFMWHAIPQSEKDRRNNSAEPLRTPTIAGGLFTIDKNFFAKLGYYDPGFDIWGAENLEISFKTWMCGGKLEIIPCSHVGHIFRAKSPYKWRKGVDVIRRNAMRLAVVWMDEYAKIYYLRSGSAKVNYGNVTQRVQLRQDLKCKSFKWYLENVFPDITIPNNLAEGYVTNLGLANNTCLDITKSLDIGFYTCHFSGGTQFVEYSVNKELRKSEHCFEYVTSLRMARCNGKKSYQEWNFNSTSLQLVHRISKKCLSSFKDKKSKVMVEECNPDSLNQKWKFQYVYEEKLDKLE